MKDNFDILLNIGVQEETHGGVGRIWHEGEIKAYE